MEQFIPAGMKWVIPFRPEWNGPFHSGRNEMAHSIPAGMDLFIKYDFMTYDIMKYLSLGDALTTAAVQTFFKQRTRFNFIFRKIE